MTRHQTLIDMIRMFATLDESRALHIHNDMDDGPRVIPYRELHRAICRAMAALRARGVGVGTRVVVPFETDERVIAMFLALIGMGALPLSIKPYLFNDKDEYRAFVRAINERYGAEHILLTPSVARLDLGGGIDLDELDLMAPDPDPPGPAAADTLHPAAPGDIAFVQLSSGSTAFPKGVPIRHDRAVENLAILYREHGMRPETPASSWLPLYHDMGLIGGLLSTMSAGNPVVLYPPTRYLMDPIGWLREQGEIGSHGFPIPNFGIDYALRQLRRAEPDELEGMDLSCVRTVYIGSEPINMELLDEFARVLGPYGLARDALMPCYGMAEAVLIVTVDRAANPKARAAPSGAHTVCLGKALGDFEMRVVRDDGTLARAGEIGEIQLAGGTLVDGYFETDEPLTGPDGFYATGDAGFILDGELYITGRLGDRMKINGQSHFASNFEHVVESVPFVRPGRTAVFQDQGRVVVLAEVRNIRSLRARAEHVGVIVDTLMDKTGVKVRPEDVHFIRYQQLAKTSSGKLRRQAIAASFRSGQIRDATPLGYLHDRTQRTLTRIKHLALLELGRARSTLGRLRPGASP